MMGSYLLLWSIHMERALAVAKFGVTGISITLLVACSVQEVDNAGAINAAVILKKGS